jgi:hypothetical protein
MYDMQGLEGGGFSAVQSSVIVPAPGEPDMYYLFTMEELEHYIDATPQILAQEPNGRGFRYFKIDMNLNNGLGDVVEADVPIYDYSFEGLCSIRHANKQDYWLLIYQDTTGIGVYSLTQNGISLSAVYPTGAPVNGGTIKSSPSSANPGAVCCQKVMTSQGLFDFDLTTGVLSNQVNLPINNETAYEFSPNGLYLYSSLTNQSNGQQQLIRYDLLDAFETGVSVESTMEVIDPTVQTSLYYMQLAPDGKIYFNHFDFPNGFTKLGTIDCPNGSAPTVNYDVLSVDISSEDAFYALPNYPSWIFYSSFDQYINLGPDTLNLCQGDTLILYAGAGDSWFWFGQLENGNTFTSTNQMVTITQPGNYTASVSGTCGQGSDIITITLDGCNQPDPEPEPEPEPDDSAPVLIAPNVFTPKNGDEVNNTYFLRNQNISYLKLIILNRWGNVVFEGESSDLLNNNPSWDGTNATEGVYFYRYEARDNNEQPFEGHGFITLIR